MSSAGTDIFLISWIIASLALIIISMVRYTYWDRRYVPVNGYLCFETDGTPYVHGEGFPNLSTADGQPIVDVFRSRLTLEPFLISFEMWPEGAGRVWRCRNQQWEPTSGGWKATVHDPFQAITVSNEQESYHWTEKSSYALPKMLCLVSTWDSIWWFVGHVTQHPNTIEAPLGQQAEILAGLHRLHDWIVASSPAPLPGLEMRQAVELLLGEEHESVINENESARAVSMEKRLQKLIYSPAELPVSGPAKD